METLIDAKRCLWTDHPLSPLALMDEQSPITERMKTSRRHTSNREAPKLASWSDPTPQYDAKAAKLALWSGAMPPQHQSGSWARPSLIVVIVFAAVWSLAQCSSPTTPPTSLAEKTVFWCGERGAIGDLGCRRERY